ncbi:MarR family winged helix-turn-helix transcriptional regulator [Phytoactinopolyspora endophytica]|uniref:MarR family winged helix-turn-helix transcriptional regulator n=1 Tax=Phytoactinopolyspora endophytica TaxID=1642495 RepID=UPI00101C5FFC|nr:MarR family winged helix-turn-helix transcriptional regulator [Phytoactinopolyspora endophytica]
MAEQVDTAGVDRGEEREHKASRGSVRKKDAPPPNAVTEPVPTIDPEKFIPRLLALVSNALVWRESSLVRQHMGLGTNDWRVLSSLALYPGASATEVSEFVGLNKAVISKSVTVLVSRGLVVLSDGPRGSRPMYLTRAGVETHDAIYPLSVSGQDIITDGLTEEEISEFTETLRGMMARIRTTPMPENGTTTETEPEA